MSVNLQDKYQLKDELGRGATARVFMAQDLTLGRQVALKRMQIAPDVSASDYKQLAARFLQEGQTLARLSHAHIPHVIESGEWESIPSIVMELIEGEKLFSYIQAQPAMKDVVLRLAEIADALHHAHTQGVVHRDIKPDNILISQHKGAWLMDFGVSRQEDSALQTSDGTMLGTIAYMAPEQLYNSAKADARCDIYSLGVVMYELFTGQLPFDGASPAAVILKIFNSEPVPPRDVLPDLPQSLADLMLKCLQKDPQQRIQNAKQIAYTLVQIAHELDKTQPALFASNQTQIGITRHSEPVSSDIKKTLGDLEGLRLSKEKIKADLKILLQADGSFNQYGLILALDQAIAEGFSGAIKVKAKNPEASSFWFKGVVWLKDGVILHAQLIREPVSARADLLELLSTTEGQFQRTAQTPSPLETFVAEDSRSLLQAIAHQLGFEWNSQKQNSSNGTISFLYRAEAASEPVRAALAQA
jgi:serine/threonine protein kinase